MRYQWEEGGFASDTYLASYYYQGSFDVVAIFEFSVEGVWSLFTYHLPWVVAIAALVVGALLLTAALLRKLQGELQNNAIAVLFTFCIAVSVGAALLEIYPLGDIRQNLYLGPIIFLAAGVAFHWMADSLAALTRRWWLAPALAVVAAGAIILAGMGAMWQDSPYKTPENIKSVLAVLDERVQEEDIVYAVWGAVPPIQFYQGEEGRPDNYYYGDRWCTPSAGPELRPCLREMVDLVVVLPNVPDRLFLLHDSTSIQKELELLGEQVSVERVIADDGIINLVLIENIKESNELAARSVYEELVSGEPALRSDFDVYLGENMLAYIKEPCVRADTEATFFLALYPVDVHDLPDHRQRHGFDNLDFNFNSRGVISNGKCQAMVSLQEYDIARISTGQFVRVVGGFHHLWEGEFSVGE